MSDRDVEGAISAALGQDRPFQVAMHRRSWTEEPQHLVHEVTTEVSQQPTVWTNLE
jgi:hypothetical protein